MLISELITVNKKMCIVILQYLTPIRILKAIKPFDSILNLSRWKIFILLLPVIRSNICILQYTFT